MEIFEAGTGHGALTLHLARAIHAANTPPPRKPSTKNPTETTSSLEEPVADAVDKNNGVSEDLYEEWRAKRRAVIHTLDSSRAHSAHAQNIVRNFRHGMYFPHVDFHVGEIREYLSSRLASNGDEPFLAHAILDLPGTDQYLDMVGKAVNPGGSLVTWTPSITQIMRCLETVLALKLPWHLEKVLEVGGSVGSGGREWDVRQVKPRARARDGPHVIPKDVEIDVEESLGNEEGVEVVPTTDESDLQYSPAERLEWVCRPKVGIRIEGGGFIGLWQRKA